MSLPRVLFVARTRYGLPLSETLERRFDALSKVLDWHQLGTARDGSAVRTARFTLLPRFPVGALDGAAFYVALPVRVARSLRSFEPDLVIVQGAQDTALALLARRLAGSSVPIVFDVHGDWRNDTRVYGSPLRRLVSPVTDRLARVAVTRADGVRTVSAFTSSLVRAQGVEPTATFPAYMDLAPFLATSPVELPTPPGAVFVGVLERYKAVDVLAQAWPLVSARVPVARLHLVGRGSLQPLVEEMVAVGDGRVRWTPELPTQGIVRALDASSALVLPSRREGMGRVIVEAFCRGRAVVGTASGGILDLVHHDVNGLLVPVGDAEGLAGALERILSDPATAARLGAGARAAASDWAATPEEFAHRMRDLVDRVLRTR